METIKNLLILFISLILREGNSYYLFIIIYYLLLFIYIVFIIIYYYLFLFIFILIILGEKGSTFILAKQAFTVKNENNQKFI